MKYIRTDFGVFGYEKDFGDMLVKTHLPSFCGGGLILKSDIIKQADTIEELCDEFVCDRKDKVFNIKPMLFNQDYDIQKEKNELLEKFEIYGAIWTDKGLIYVAKVNEKGELELL